MNLQDGKLIEDPDSLSRFAMDKWCSRTTNSLFTRKEIPVHDVVPSCHLIDQFKDMSIQPLAMEDNIQETPVKVVHFTDIISVQAPSGPTCQKNIIAVLDQSHSMNNEVKDSDGKRHGYTILDLVKHAVSTVVANLRGEDTMTGISFASKANIFCNRTSMDRDGKARFMSLMENLQPSYSDNIWQALHIALEQAELQNESGQQTEIWVLTDGVSTKSRRGKGVNQSFKDYLKENPLPNVTVHTFGFGYKINSHLLDNMARIGMGRFHFIPDVGSVGTIFNHAIANSLCTRITHLKVEGRTYPSLTSGTTLIIPHCNLHTATISFSLDGQAVQTIKTEKNTSIVRDISLRKVANDMAILHLIKKCLKHKNLTTLQEKMEQNIVTPYEPILSDYRDQVMEAFKLDHLNKWGKHYIRAWLHCHESQVAINFTDASSKTFGDSVFRQLLDQCTKTFNTLPPPPPPKSFKYHQDLGHVNNKITTMSTTHNQTTGCFGPNTLVMTLEGLRPIHHLNKGDKVYNGRFYSKIKCMIHIHGRSELVQLLDGTQISKYHPLMLNGEWTFPKDLQNKICTVTEVYNMVLEDTHRVQVNTFLACTLGHELKGPVIGHDFFGTQKVIDALKKCKGWTEGKVNLDQTMFQREDEQGRVIDLIQKSC